MSQDATESIREAATGTDEPMGKKHPAAPGMLVMAAYPIALILLILAAFAVMAFFN